MRAPRIGLFTLTPLVFAAFTAFLAAACDEPIPGPPRPIEEAPPAEPVIPGMEELSEPSRGQSQVVLPVWNADDTRFDHPIRQLQAKLGRSQMVSQVLLGEDAESGVMITFYGEGFVPGSYPVLPATDETRTAHAGRDSKVCTVTVGMGEAEALRSTEGLVTIETADDGSVTGRVEATVQSRNNLRDTPTRARFFAIPEQWLEAQLEQQEAIREQLRSRNRR